MLFKIRAALVERLRKRLGMPEIPAALERLAMSGFSPELVFDVGAFRGEFAMLALSTWPSARVACFEPLRQGRAEIVELQKRFPRIDLYGTLVGSSERAEVSLHVAETSTSLLRDAHNDEFPVETFPQTTLSAVIHSKYAGRAPDLLKIDVQGYELEVLKGCDVDLGGVRVILTELNLLDLHEGVPLIHEVMQWLAARGFVAYDICGLTRRPLDKALWQTDMIFVRKDDPLRRDKGYFPGKSWFR